MDIKKAIIQCYLYFKKNLEDYIGIGQIQNKTFRSIYNTMHLCEDSFNIHINSCYLLDNRFRLLLK
jgi:hypothetical protein